MRMKRMMTNIDTFTKTQNLTQSRKARKVNLLILANIFLTFLTFLTSWGEKNAFCEFVNIGGEI